MNFKTVGSGRKGRAEGGRGAGGGGGAFGGEEGERTSLPVTVTLVSQWRLVLDTRPSQR